MSAVDHGKRAHALLSASGASRWMACTPSARLEEDFKEESSSYAQEGTFAHEMSDIKLGEWAGDLTRRKASIERKALEGKIKKQMPEVDLKEMDEETDKYTDYVQEVFAEDPDSMIIIEERVDFSDWVPHGFGTGDTIIVTPNVMHVIDLKYGKGVAVSAVNNPQLRLYALGALKPLLPLYEFTEVVVHIVQPRLNEYSSERLTVKELLDWAENEVKPKAKMAWAGEGDTVAGDHCRWCKAAPRCRALSEKAAAMAAADFSELELLDDEEVLDMYDMADAITQYIKGLKEYVLKEAINGKQWPGLKLVESVTKRRLDTSALDEIIKKAEAEGFKRGDLVVEKAKPFSVLDKLFTGEQYEKVLGPHVTKPDPSPALAPLDSNRKEWGTTAADDFKD